VFSAERYEVIGQSITDTPDQLSASRAMSKSLIYMQPPTFAKHSLLSKIKQM
jgi:hypothetical protein